MGGQDERPRQQAAVQDQDLQEADRGDRGALQARRGSNPPLNQNYLRHIAQEPRSPTLYRLYQKRPPWCTPKTKRLFDHYIHSIPSMTTPPCMKNPKKR